MKQSVICERINTLEGLMKANASGIKVKTLHVKLQEIFKETKTWYRHTVKDKGDPMWIENLEYKLDMCSADVMEHLEKTENKDKGDRQGNLQGI